MNKNVFAPWELEGGQTQALPQEKVKRFFTKEQLRQMFTRENWKHKGRTVLVADSDAIRVVSLQRTGRTLYLFSEDQTAPLP